MLKNKFQLICLLFLFAEYGSCIKSCSSWQDYWNFYGANSCKENVDDDDEFAGIVGRWNKKVETHEIITYDGYILTLFRILPKEKDTPPVLLLHGVFMNSLAFVNRGTKSLAYQFADKGYDVWLLNWRGSKYSRRHIGMKSYEAVFWRFSLHELGVYDLPQALREIKKSNDQKVLLVGFHIGNTASYIYSTTYPDEAQENLSGIVSLSPTGAPINVGLLTKTMFYMWPIMMKHMLLYFYHGEVPAIYQSIRATLFCRNLGVWFARFCDAYYMSAIGLDIKQQDPETLRVIIAVNKDSNSLMQFSHFSQMIKERRFQNYDHGEEKNLAIYGQKKPPAYNMTKLNVPQLFFVGRNDKSGTLQDATVMYQQIPTEYQKEFYVIEYDKFGLADFVQAKDINDFLHTHLMASVTELVPPLPAQQTGGDA